MKCPVNLKKQIFFVILITTTGISGLADGSVLWPSTSPNTASIYPFLLKQLSLTSMRYQQVYAASLFSNVPPDCIYVTGLTFWQAPGAGVSWTITNMQINFSTTQRSADNLSTNFADNVGADDTVVLGPTRHDFSTDFSEKRLPFVLDRPFYYNPAKGNLLLDIRILNGAGPIDLNSPGLATQTSSTDEVSVVYSTNVDAAFASIVSTTGLETLIQLSAIPRLTIYVSTFNSSTTYLAIEWPEDPNVFVLQQSLSLGSNALWRTVPNAPAPLYYFPLNPAGPPYFYWLVWPSGQPPQ